MAQMPSDIPLVTGIPPRRHNKQRTLVESIVLVSVGVVHLHTVAGNCTDVAQSRLVSETKQITSPTMCPAFL